MESLLRELNPDAFYKGARIKGHAEIVQRSP
jgi:hypothetical protein